MSSEFISIHRSLFGSLKGIDENLCRQYNLAVDFVLGKATQLTTLSVQIDRALMLDLDLEAIEYFLRMRYGRNQLTQRFQILSFLAESRSEYYDFYVNEEFCRSKALLKLIYLAMRSAGKLLKGMYLTKRYHLV